MINFRRVPRHFDKFVTWFENGRTLDAQVTISWEHWMRNRTPASNVDQFREAMRAQLNKEQAVNIKLDDAILPTVGDFTFAAPVQNLEITTRASVKIQRRTVGAVLIHTAAKLSLVDCQIGVLEIHVGNASLDLADTFVGTIVLHADGLSWTMHGGSLLNIDVRHDLTGNRFGRVEFQRVYLPRDRSEFSANPQEYRDARAQLLERNNTLAAAIFHGAELALDRPLEQRSSQFASWLYEVLSDFGNSITRPFGWFLVMVVLVAGVSATFDVTTVGVPPTELIGWQMYLCDPFWGRLMRGATYALRGIINPFNIFNAEPLVVSNSPVWAFGLTFLSLIGTLSLGLVAVGIRRRFKLE